MTVTESSDDRLRPEEEVIAEDKTRSSSIDSNSTGNGSQHRETGDTITPLIPMKPELSLRESILLRRISSGQLPLDQRVRHQSGTEDQQRMRRQSGTEFGSKTEGSWFVSRASGINEFGSRGLVFDENETTVPNAVWPQIVAALSVSFASMMIGIASAYTAPAITSMNEPNSTLWISLDGSEASWMGSLTPLGAFIGGLIGFVLAEKLGRRNTILSTAIPFMISWLLIGLASNIWMIYAGRTIAGMCIGLIGMSLPIYLAEAVQPEVRGVLGLVPTTVGNFGILISYLAGSYLDWQQLAFLACGLCLPYLIFMIMIPESPSWYIAHDNEEKAEKSLQWLRGGRADIRVEFSKIKQNHILSKKMESKMTDLFNKTYICLFLKVAVILLVQQFSGINAVIFYATPIFNMSGSSIEKSQCSIIIGVVNIVAVFLAITVIDRIGRKPLLLISGIFMILSLGVLATFFYAKEHKIQEITQFGWIPLVGLMSYVLAFSLGFGPIPWLIMGEIFPARIRGPAAAMITASKWCFAFLVTKSFPPFASTFGVHTAFMIYAIIIVLGLVFIMIVIPETKGQSLEDIEQSLKKIKPDPAATANLTRRVSSVSSFQPFPTSS